MLPGLVAELQQLGEDFSRGGVVEGRPGPRIEFMFGSDKFGRTVFYQVCELRETLAQQPGDFFIAASLPGTCQVAEINPGLGWVRNLQEFGYLPVLIPGQGLAKPLRNTAEDPNQRISEFQRICGFELDEVQLARGPLHLGTYR